MPSVFPALRGKMGDLSYAVTTMKLGEVNRIVQYAEAVQDWETVTPELRTQRRLNLNRVRREMAPYLLNNDDHFFSAITVELRGVDGATEIPFREAEDNPDIGQVWLDGTETLMCTDGQHRLKAIELALKEEPRLGTESIAVIIVPYKSVIRSQGLFADLNRYAKQPTKTLNILYSSRDFRARLAKAVANKSRYLHRRVNLESNTLSRRSPQIVTLGVLYECVGVLLGKEDSKAANLDQKTAEIVHVYDDVVFPALMEAAPELDQVWKRELPAHELRTRYIFAHSVGQQAIARVVRAALDQRPDDWEGLVHGGFSQIPWDIGIDWEGVATMGGTLANRSQNVRRTAALIKAWVGLQLSDTEVDDLTKAKQASGDPDWKLPQPLTAA